ncbi:MAG: hypothetical protein LUB58_04735, partial [Oscillospiraceae bacterium]|nr:hypothetical protein [Oscillospiraceae bacterium]
MPVSNAQPPLPHGDIKYYGKECVIITWLPDEKQFTVCKLFACSGCKQIKRAGGSENYGQLFAGFSIFFT